MPPQPSSSSTRMSNGNDSNIQSEPRIDVKYLMTELCNILEFSTDEDEISSESFIKSVLEKVGEVVERDKESRRLIGVLYDRVQPRAQATASEQSNTNSESSQVRQSESNVLVVDLTQVDDTIIPALSPEMSIESVPVSPCHPEVISVLSSPQHGASPYSSASPFCIISGTYHVETPERRDTDSIRNVHNGDRDIIRSPALPPTLPRESSQSTPPSVEEIGQSQSTNEADIRASVGVEDSLFNDLLETPQPSTSRQSLPRKTKERKSNTSSEKKTRKQDMKANKKKTKQRISKDKEVTHARKYYDDGDYKFHCTCGSKFKSKSAQRLHVRRLNVQWNFTCDHCPEKFYTLSDLREHLTKHGIRDALKEYVRGCTLCGEMFCAVTAFYSHRDIVHNINQGPQSPRRPWRTFGPRQLDSPSQNHMLSQPRDVEIEVVQNIEDEVTPQHVYMPGLVRDNEEERNIESPEASNSSFPPDMSQPEHPNGNGINGNLRGNGNLERNSQKNYKYSCGICGQAFVSFFGSYTNMRKHMRRKHKSRRRVVKCGECGEVFGTCQSFDEHWVSSNH